MTESSNPTPITPAASESYLTEGPWQRNRPSVLVVACSDGRLQQNLDDFLHNSLGIMDYDRLYAPGGGGALAANGPDLLRSDALRHECQLLLEAHDISDIYFMFHGPSEDGPEESLCAGYRLKFPSATAQEVREQQQRDADELGALDWGADVRLHAYRCEVRPDDRVQFVRLL
ncbi:MAG: hypothetical protein IPM61_07325 [Chlorobi bacterium]|nr:MAG: hypothetical protein UZ07_CHB004003342 [Chlorobi bacterium OLB7]MBK8911126.1 hypothetical protein [Chlorobiota bacterium]MBX7216676.1 hypothetical protein [Candidatus Kapabacteria bacterium]